MVDTSLSADDRSPCSEYERASSSSNNKKMRTTDMRDSIEHNVASSWVIYTDLKKVNPCENCQKGQIFHPNGVFIKLGGHDASREYAFTVCCFSP
ncbi:hypothetical protein T06_8561 [Trichinella sp. T6]|nr:hypothetical protein T06_8561 [Trichinella sp. T6]